MKFGQLSGIFFLSFTVSLSAFELKTRVYPADTEVTLRLVAASPWAKNWISTAAAMKKSGQFKLKKGVRPLLGYMREDRRHSTGNEFVTGHPEPLDFTISGNRVTAKVRLRGEYIHTLAIYNPRHKDKKSRNYKTLDILSLDKETFKLRPFKGNVHQHSNVSDGRFAPGILHLAYARRVGFDFIAIADHHAYKQNAMAIKAAADSRCGITVYPGEEMHSPGNILHSLSIGGTRLHSQTKRDAKWMKAVKPIHDELIRKFPALPHDQLLPWAESIVLARRAKADGAFVVYCHPAWRRMTCLNNTTEMMEFIIRSKEFHAIEVLNGTGHLSNAETLARFHELCVELGTTIPVISTSDCHNVYVRSYRSNYSVIFAPDCTFPSFKEAFLKGRAVAAMEVPDRAGRLLPFNLGAFKYVRYANFLHKSGYWRLHDGLAARQFKLLLKYEKGDKSVLPAIADLAKTIDQYREAFYYKPGK